MSIFVLKFIAVFFMVVDHVKYVLPFCVNDFTLYFGRIAFPLFAFCTVQGYIHTHDLARYVKRLVIAGTISEIPFLLFNSLPTLQYYGLNIMFTLTLGILALTAYDYFQGNVKGWISVIAIAFLADITMVDYGRFGVFLMFSFYVFKDSKLKTFLASLIVVAIKYLYRILILGARFQTISNKKLDMYINSANTNIVL